MQKDLLGVIHHSTVQYKGIISNRRKKRNKVIKYDKEQELDGIVAEAGCGVEIQPSLECKWRAETGHRVLPGSGQQRVAVLSTIQDNKCNVQYSYVKNVCDSDDS